VLRLGFIIAFIAVIGVCASGIAAFRIYEQELSIDRGVMARNVDTHSSLVQERLTEREVLTRVAVGLFRFPAASGLNVLEPLRTAIYAFKTDFVMASWIAHVQPPQVPVLQQELNAAGLPDPSVRKFDDTPFNVSELSKPIDVLIDVEPRDPDTTKFIGRILDTHPILGPTLVEAAQERRPVASIPLTLARSGGPLGVALVAAVPQQNSADIAGFITFSYRLAPLMLANSDTSLFSVALSDPRSAGTELTSDSQGDVISSPNREAADGQALVRQVSFGGREWTLNYHAKVDSRDRARELAVIVMIIGLAVTGVLCGLFGYVAYNNVRLSREIETRIGFERRLTAVIDELNHRVKNILAVIQSIITRTLRHGADIDVARELLIGRIHAMSNVVTLLSDSQWQGVKIRGLFESRAIPHSERIELDGPDITVSARAAQSLSLLFFELASHSDEGLSLVGKHPHILAKWTVTGEGAAATFDFRWEEFNTSAATRRPDTDFGTVLLERVVPEALGGTTKRYFTDNSYVFELHAPMDTVIDQIEMDRTERLSAPLPSR